MGSRPLSPADAKSLAEITNTIGGWGDLATLSIQRKIDHILYSTPTFASFLLKLFESQNIQERINADMKKLLSNQEIKETIFAICVLTLAGVKASYSLITEIAKTDIIRSSAIKEIVIFNDFFKIKSYDTITLSPLFAQHFLRTQFSAVEICDRFLKTAEKFEKIKKNAHANVLIFKHMLKFSSLDRALPEKYKKSTFNDYYDRLKRRISWLERDPHFWLQYGMANTALKEYPNAQRHLDNSYKFAEQKGQFYDKSNIDTQQARLWLLQYSDADDPDNSFKFFKDADRKLKSLVDDKYKYRQLEMYPKIIKKTYKGLSGENRKYMEKSCEYIEKRTQFESGSIHDEAYMDRIRIKIVQAITEESEPPVNS